MPKIDGIAAINGISTGISEFQGAVNDYIDQLNGDNRRVNAITAVGYFITAGTALASFFLT
ncbi:MAG: hypothetical protein IPM25_00915 [Chloracidobacterium sp.]|nr:hypothetical protein [Chloracidobacterium sp.]